MLFTRTNSSASETSSSNEGGVLPASRERFVWGDLGTFALIVLLFVLPIRLFVAQPFIVNGSSMDPTFGNGQYLIVDELTYRLDAPKRGDVIVFNFPDDTKKFFIKRIIGLPGETVAIANGAVRITNTEHPEGFALDEPYVTTEHASTDTMTVTLNEHDYFVMGDNRNASFDSRAWGPLEEDLIVGRAFLRLFPLQTISIFPGNHGFE
jgi:signal peptidase I